MFTDTVLEIGMASICPSISFGFVKVDICIQKSHGFLAEFMSRFNGGMYFIHFVNEFLKFVNWVRPNNEYVVDESKVIEWDKMFVGRGIYPQCIP